MADEKGGSDLDVFEGLAKKANRPSNIPGSIPSMGGTSPNSNVAAPAAPVAPPSLRNAKSTLLGVSAPVPPPNAQGAPIPPPSLKPSTKPPLPPSAPPPPSVAAPIPAPPAPPATATPLPIAPPTPVPPPVSKPPATLLAAVPPPPKPPSSIGSALGIPAAPESVEELTPARGHKKRKNDAGVEMDWEDEEESTHVFEKQLHAVGPKANGPRPAAGDPGARLGNAVALAATSGAAAAPAKVPPVAAPPPSAPPPKVELQVSATPLPLPSAPPPPRRPSEEPTVVRPRESSGRLGVILGGLALVSVVCLGVYSFMPRTGQLKIDLKSKSGAQIGKAEIHVDGQKRCDSTPCIVDQLEAGPRSIKVILGDVAAQEVATVEAGKERSVVISIDDTKVAAPTAPSSAPTASSSAAPASEGTGIRLKAPSGVKLFVDGKERGVFSDSPIALTDLTPGEHKLKIDGGDRYETVEKTVQVQSNKVDDLGEQKPKVIKGKLTLELATQGASVVLSVTQNGKKVDKKLDETIWSKPPVTVNLDPKDQIKLIASKRGFQDFSQDITFADGVADQTIVITLTEVGKPASTVPNNASSSAPTATTTTTAKDPAPTGNGTLSMNSLPVSKVVLDGRPLGNTPQTQSVSPGKHTVMFIHPDKGRKTVSVDVKPGGKAVATAKFD